LLRSGSEIQALLAQLRLHTPMTATPKKVTQREEPPAKSKSTTASCNCQHCGKEFQFYIEGYTDEKSFGRCPGCGKLTKLRLPAPAFPSGKVRNGPKRRVRFAVQRQSFNPRRLNSSVN